MSLRTTALLAIAAWGLSVHAATAAEPARSRSAAAAIGVVRSDASGVPDGAHLFAANCARCHGATGRGDGPDAQFFVRPPRDLRSGVLDRYTTEELVARIREGTPLRLDLDPKAMRERTRDVELLVAFLPRLPAIDWAKVEPGNDIYLDRCEACHGPFGRPLLALPPGVQRPPRDLSSPEFQRSVSDRELRQIVQHGRNGMPAIPALQSSSDADLLVAFVRTLSPGRELYGVYCASCHGEDGRGGSPLGDAEVPHVVFDRAYFASHDPEVLRQKVWHMVDREAPEMPHLGRRLSEAQARAIVEYLRSERGPAPAPSPMH
ncbi:MAG TPA: c-type cytochrome [Candidatus Binatia bacterium]|nr:c-type cytochrome [Candidatus Binatia bacterium]